MAALDDLNTAVSTITDAVTQASAKITALAAQIASASSGDDPDAPAIENAVGELNTLAANLLAVVNPPAAPAPAPAA